MSKEQELLYQILGEIKDLSIKVEVNTVYQKGHGQRLDKLEPRVQTLVDEKNIAVGKKTVWTMIFGAIGGAVIAAGKYITDYLSNHH